MSEETIKEFISEIARVLIASGHLFLWVDLHAACGGAIKGMKIVAQVELKL